MVALGNGLENHALKHLEPHWAPRRSSRSHVQFLYLYLLQNRTECTFQPETVLLPFVFSLQHYTQQTVLATCTIFNSSISRYKKISRSGSFFPLWGISIQQLPLPKMM